MDRTLDVASGQVFLITDDGRGVAARVADQLRQCGAHPVLLLGAGTDTQGEDIYQVDLGNAGAVKAVVAQVRSALGPIAGLVHLAGLGERGDFRDMSVADWRECQRREVKSLFYLAKAASSDLKQATSKRNGAWVLAASAMGGAFAMEDTMGYPLSPGQAGLAGLMKSLALEWPAVSCKAVDLDVRSAPEMLARQIMAELAAADGLVQVGYAGERRCTLQPVLTPLVARNGQAAQMMIEPDWVILVTGGARWHHGRSDHRTGRVLPAHHPTGWKFRGARSSGGRLHRGLVVASGDQGSHHRSHEAGRSRGCYRRS